MISILCQDFGEPPQASFIQVEGPAYQFFAEMHLNAETRLLLHSAQVIFKIANDAFVHGVNLRVL